VRRIADREAMAALLLAESAPGDLILTLGAGDLNRFAEELVRRLGETRGVH
jgi:UDP-N-acetylmuramate-alanine ligase